MVEVAALIRDRVRALSTHSPVSRELRYVAERLELASQSPPPAAVTRPGNRQ